MTQPRYDLMTIGHFAKDAIVVDGKSESASGGGVYFGAMAARRLGLDVAVVTRLHPDDFALLDELRQAGIDVFATPAAQTSGIENRYRSANMERRDCIPTGFAGPFTPQDLPDASARVFVIASIIAGEVDLNLLGLIAKRGPVALDIQGFVRVEDCGILEFRPWAQMREGLRHVTFLKVDRAEAEMLTGATDLASAARQLAEYGPKEIVLTESSGVTVLAGGQLFQAPFTPRSLVGRTGRGDTCFHTYLGTRLTASPLEATRLAAAVTTLKQERPGPWRGTLADAEAVMRSWEGGAATRAIAQKR
jgi:sugar/nucleoside kinase (ribokinase family)